MTNQTEQSIERMKRIIILLADTLDERLGDAIETMIRDGTRFQASDFTDEPFHVVLKSAVCLQSLVQEIKKLETEQEIERELRSHRINV